jgi:hypothetical protein
MTDRNPPEEYPAQAATGGTSLEEAAEDGPLPETDDIDEAAETGRDTSETDDPVDNADCRWRNPRRHQPVPVARPGSTTGLGELPGLGQLPGWGQLPA